MKLVLAIAALVAATSPLPVRAKSPVAEACTPKAASGDVASQSADATSLALDAAHAAAIANWDVRWWQRHRVWITLEARNDGDAATGVLPQMVVDARADGGAGSVLVGLPLALAPHARATQRLAIWIPDDAKTLGVRALLAMPAQPVAVRLALECSSSRFDAGELSPAVASQLDEAVKTWFNGYVDPLSDVPGALRSVRVLASGAQDADDIAWTMRGLMQTVHDDHGFAAAPGEPAPAPRALVTRAPELELRSDGVAVVRLHALDTHAQDAALAWAGALHDGVAALAARHPRGWVIDLRDHDGESAWPSLAGLSSLLDGPVVGATITRAGSQDWIVERGSVRLGGGPALVDLQAAPEPDFRGAIAVLLGAGTRNAGEDVAVALRGRAHTKTFGATTAGFPDLGMQVHRLADGTRLGVLEARAADRTGVVHRVPLDPDVVLAPDAGAAALPAQALDWIEDERGRLPPGAR